MSAAAGMVPPLPLLLMEGILNKTYRLAKGGRKTLAGIGHFNPFFVAVDEHTVEKIEESYWFKKGQVVIAYEEKVIEVVIPKVEPITVTTKLSRRALFAQHGEKINSAPFLAVQRVALELGMTEEETAGLSRAKLMKFIRRVTIQ